MARAPKFRFHENGLTGEGRVIFDVQDLATGRHIGLVHGTSSRGWVAYVAGVAEDGFTTRAAACERLLLVSHPSPVSSAALPADPFEGLV